MELSAIWMPLLGGALIGLASVLLLVFNGRIAGISGIFGGALAGLGRDGRWRWGFVAGLVVGGLALFLLMPSVFDNRAARTLPVIVLAGFLVGFGTRMGSGCTSGHGICGIGRMSPRSILATVTFIITGVVGAALGNHVFPKPADTVAIVAPVQVSDAQANEHAAGVRTLSTPIRAEVR